MSERSAKVSKSLDGSHRPTTASYFICSPAGLSSEHHHCDERHPLPRKVVHAGVIRSLCEIMESGQRPKMLPLIPAIWQQTLGLLATKVAAGSVVSR
jgi:hypothetical protein